MFASSIALIFLSLAALAGAFVAFAWAWSRGLLEAHPDDAALALDEHDLRVARPWESAPQALERIAAHGPAIPPRPGEWGGA